MKRLTSADLSARSAVELVLASFRAVDEDDEDEKDAVCACDTSTALGARKLLQDEKEEEEEEKKEARPWAAEDGGLR